MIQKIKEKYLEIKKSMIEPKYLYLGYEDHKQLKLYIDKLSFVEDNCNLPNSEILGLTIIVVDEDNHFNIG